MTDENELPENGRPEDAPPENPQPAYRQRLRRAIYTVIIAATAGILLAGLFNSKPLQSANDRSRWSTVWSLVERETYQIDEIDNVNGWTTIDKVRHDGHFYSSKPPLLPTMVAGLYWCLKKISDADLRKETTKVAHRLLFFVNILPMLLALLVVARLVERYADHDFTRVYIVVAASLATLLTPFLMTFNNHTVAAVSVIFAVYPAMRIVIDGQKRLRDFVVCGLFAAFACCNELPAALYSVAIFLMVLRADFKRTAFYFVPAALLVLGAFFYTNYLATGDWKPFYAYYGTEKYLYVHEGVPSYWMNPGGFDRSIDSPGTYFLHCTVGHHGILSLSPIYLLTLLGWCFVRRRSQTAFHLFLWLGMVLTAGVLGFYMSRTANYNYGGNSAALRWMLWLIPLWLIGMIPVLDAWGRSRTVRGIAALLLIASTFSAFAPYPNPWQSTWLYDLLDEWELVDYSEPPPTFEFDRRLQTWFPNLPKTAPAGQGQWIEFTAPDSDGLIRLRLTDLGTTDLDGAAVRQIEVQRQHGPQPATTTVYHIDEQAFDRGKTPPEFLRWPMDSEVSAQEKADAATFFRGFPRPRPYRPGVIRYLKTKLRTDAFRCQRAASQIDHSPAKGSPKLRYRCDTWMCDDVPFGALQFITTVSELSSGVIISRHQFTAVAASDFPKTADQAGK